MHVFIPKPLIMFLNLFYYLKYNLFVLNRVSELFILYTCSKITVSLFKKLIMDNSNLKNINE